MAGIIPRMSENVRMSPSSPVPITSAGSVDPGSEMRSEAWGQIAKFGEALQRHQTAQDAADDRIREEEATNNVRDGLVIAKDEAARESKEDGSDYHSLFQQKVSERMDSIYGGDGTAKMSPATVQRVKAFGSMAYQQTSTQIQVESAKKLEQSNYNRLSDLSDTSANRVRQDPSEPMLGAEVKSYSSMLDDMVQSGGISAENATKARQAHYQNVAGQYIEGLSEKKQFGAALTALQGNQENPDLFTEIEPTKAQQLGFIDSRQAQELLDNGENFKQPILTSHGGKAKLSPALSEVMNGMDPKHKAAWIDSIQGKALADSAQKLSELNAQVTGFEQIAMSGAQYSDKSVAAIKDQINANPHLTTEARVRMMDMVNTADTVNKQVKLMADTPRSQWGKIADGLDTKMNLSQNYAGKFDSKMKTADQDFAVQASRLQAKEKLVKFMGQIEKFQNDRPAEYVLQTDSDLQTLYSASKSGNPDDVQRYVRASIQKQDYLGIPGDKQKVLLDAKGEADRLASMPNGYEIGNQIDKLQQTYGQYFPKVMSEIASQDPSMAKYQTMTYAPAGVRADLADAIKNEKSINEAFQNSPGYAANNTAIKNNVSLKMESLQKSLLMGSSTTNRQNIVNSMAEAVELQARRDATRPGGDPGKAVEDAYDKTINSQFQFSSGGNSQVLVPRQIGQMRMEDGIVDAFLRAHSTTDGIKELNPSVPGKYATPDDYHQILAREGRWVTNPQFDGVELKLRDQDSGQMMPVLDKYGRPLEVKYQDINMKPSERTKKSSGFLGRMFGG